MTPPCTPPTQVLLDWELGDMTGLDVLKHIKKRSPDTTARLIMVSGNEPSSEERAEFQEVRLSHAGFSSTGALLCLTTSMPRARLRRPAQRRS